MPPRDDHDLGHGGDSGDGHGEHSEPPHAPAPADPPFHFFTNPLLPQGAGLSGIAFAALWLLARAWKLHFTVGLVATVPLLIVAALAGWAAAIHLTGGEKFDDHPWV